MAKFKSNKTERLILLQRECLCRRSIEKNAVNVSNTVLNMKNSIASVSFRQELYGFIFPV